MANEVKSSVNKDGSVTFGVSTKKVAKKKTTPKTTTANNTGNKKKSSTTSKKKTTKPPVKEEPKTNIDPNSGDEIIEMSGEEFASLLAGNAPVEQPENKPQVSVDSMGMTSNVEDGEIIGTQTVAAGRNRTNYIYYEIFINGKNDDLLAIGVIDSEGDYFYAEATDFNFADLNNDIFTNVLSKFENPATKCEGKNWTVKGTTEEISNSLIRWINEVVVGDVNRELVLVSSVPAITYHKLMQLLKHNTDEYPKNVITVTIDVNQDMANLMYVERPEEASDEMWNITAVPVIVATGYDLNMYAQTLPTYKSIGYDPMALHYANSYRAFHQFTYALV